MLAGLVAVGVEAVLVVQNMVGYFVAPEVVALSIQAGSCYLYQGYYFPYFLSLIIFLKCSMDSTFFRIYIFLSA